MRVNKNKNRTSRLLITNGLEIQGKSFSQCIAHTLTKAFCALSVFKKMPITSLRLSLNSVIYKSKLLNLKAAQASLLTFSFHPHQLLIVFLERLFNKIFFAIIKFHFRLNHRTSYANALSVLVLK